MCAWLLAPIRFRGGLTEGSHRRDRQSVIDDGVSKRLTLIKGANILRCAVINGGGATDFCARFLDRNDVPIKSFTIK
jgi:hypothetical protein